MRPRTHSGQALILTLFALSIFLLGALGFGIDVSHLYSQRQLAQAAADAAATAGVHSIYGKTNTAAYNNDYGSADFDCTATDLRTPCLYARDTGFGKNSSDTVSVAFANSLPGVKLSTECNPSVVKVTVRRKVDTTLMRLLGPSNAYIVAQATAACVAIDSPVPILVLHPTLSQSFLKSGGNTIQICGGPQKSIQVNSKNATAVNNNGGGVIDLSKAGPKDNGACATGTGTAMGVWGGPSAFPGGVCPSGCNGLRIGTTGRYGYPESKIPDPLADVFPNGIPAPAYPALPPTLVPSTTPGCSVGSGKPCYIYYPGRYPMPGNIDLQIKNRVALFAPGLYWVDKGGFQGQANSNLAMCTTCATDPVTGSGMIVYNTGNGANDIFDVGSNGSANLQGPPNGSIYKGIIFFQDRTSPAHTGSGAHKLGGGGDLQIRGTIYLTNTEARMLANPARYQELRLRGNSGNLTKIYGEIIVDVLNMGGNSTITMQLDPDYLLPITQVALVR